MTILILVRHGRSTANADGILAGRMPDVHLDEVGKEQAKSLEAVLEGVTRAYTSPVLRCRQTAAHAGFPDAEVVDGLSECDYGDWTGRKLAELAEEGIWATVQKQPSAVEFPGGETMLHMRNRVVAAIEGIVSGGEAAVVFSHGDPLKAILAHALGLDFDEFQRIDVAPGSVSVVDWSGFKPIVRLMGGGLDARRAFLSTHGPVVGGGVA